MHMQKPIEWSQEKNEWLKKDRGVCFEDVITAMESGGHLATIPHPNQKRYPDQKIFIVRIRSYAYSVPFVEDDSKMFLKTMYANRHYTKKYLQT